ncbi:MAG TPA: DUF1640 domain-containing protein, partial [Clostridiales bacterium]|nr:DUF1640 domain-containing protein [Clostridiales bacterium]
MVPEMEDPKKELAEEHRHAGQLFYLGGWVQSELKDIRQEIRDVRLETKQEIGTIRQEIGTLRQEMRQEFGALRQ